MIITSATHLLFVEPTLAPTELPIIDDITRRLTSAWRVRQTDPTSRSRGVHSCTGAACHAHSDNADHLVAGLLTHSLCIHYVAFHRSEIPARDLERISRFELGHSDPTAAELGSDASAGTYLDAEARWQAALPHRKRRDMLLRAASQTPNPDDRRDMLIRAENEAVASGVSPRPDYFANMGVARVARSA